MSDSLFLLGADRVLKTVPPAKFQTEDIFQELLAKYPQLLTDVEAGAESPRRWVLVKREAGVPVSEDGGSYFSVDHLFLDQDGVPTLVEVKRASDTRARREVVAQMLDYAANAVSFWRVEDLTNAYAATCAQENADSTARLGELLQTETPDVQAFWLSVQANLSSRRIRMIFVADRISPDLERIVEFLNEQMSPATVLGLELRPFENGPDRILSPRLIGATTRATAQKNVSAPIAASIDEWLSQDAARDRVEKYLDLVKEIGGQARMAGKALAIEVGSNQSRVSYIRHHGSASIALYQLRKCVAFEAPAAREAIISDLKKLGFDMSTGNVDGEPSFDLPQMDEVERWSRLRQYLSELFAKIASSQ